MEYACCLGDMSDPDCVHKWSELFTVFGGSDALYVYVFKKWSSQMFYWLITCLSLKIVARFFCYSNAHEDKRSCFGNYFCASNFDTRMRGIHVQRNMWSLLLWRPVTWLMVDIVYGFLIFVSMLWDINFIYCMNLTERLDIIAVKLLNKWFKALGVLPMDRVLTSTQKYDNCVKSDCFVNHSCTRASQ